MQLAKIVGNAVSSHAHKSVRGNALFICQPINDKGEECGDVLVAINPIGGGMGSKVIIAADGKAARAYVGGQKTPLKHVVIGLADE